jgi:hypothetical protein
MVDRQREQREMQRAAIKGKRGFIFNYKRRGKLISFFSSLLYTQD